MKNLFDINKTMNLFSEDLSYMLKKYEDVGNQPDLKEKWATTIMISLVPFDLERSGLKRGKYLSGSPSKKANKFLHYFDEQSQPLAILEFIDNYDLPASFMIFEKLSLTEENIYKFDIENKLDFVIEKKRENNLLINSCQIFKNENYILEEYIYENEVLVKINREHKDKRMFKNIDFFPDNIFKSQFIFDYKNTEISEIKWNGTPDKTFRKVYP